MDIQQMIDNALAAKTAERMKTSEQLTLAEFILLLKAVKDENKSVIFDDAKFIPSHFDSWRGVYADLMLAYDDFDESKLKSVFYWLSEAINCIGKEFTGYKGGDFVMGKNTPLWVARWGSCAGFKEDEENELYYQAIVGVRETETFVVIETAPMDT